MSMDTSGCIKTSIDNKIEVSNQAGIKAHPLKENCGRGIGPSVPRRAKAAAQSRMPEPPSGLESSIFRQLRRWFAARLIPRQSQISHQAGRICHGLVGFRLGARAVTRAQIL